MMMVVEMGLVLDTKKKQLSRYVIVIHVQRTVKQYQKSDTQNNRVITFGSSSNCLLGTK